MWLEVKEDFKREVELSTYASEGSKIFHALTSPGFQAVFLFRMTHWLGEHRIPLLGIILQRLCEVWTGVSISPKTKIGSGLVIYHFGGIIINGSAELGKSCTLHHDVTIGNRRPGEPSPKIGDRVMIGAGARVLGDIVIGNDVEIGANAVVLDSLPDGAVAVGIPARVAKIKGGVLQS